MSCASSQPKSLWLPNLCLAFRHRSTANDVVFKLRMLLFWSMHTRWHDNRATFTPKLPLLISSKDKQQTNKTKTPRESLSAAAEEKKEGRSRLTIRIASDQILNKYPRLFLYVCPHGHHWYCPYWGFIHNFFILFVISSQLSSSFSNIR